MTMVLFSGSMKGKFPASIRRIVGTFKKISKDSLGKTEFIYAAETFTSQICSQGIKTKSKRCPQVQFLWYCLLS